MRDAILGLSLFLTVGCTEPARPTEPAPAPSRPAAAAEQDALQRAEAAATDLGQTLRGRLLGAMQEGGPAGAMRVCADEAQTIAREAGARHGARLGRSSLRLRNPADAPPDWVAAWLSEQGERSGAGVTGFARVEEGRARVLRPIVVEAPCVSCHGPRESIAPEVAAILAERYPSDAATGYAAGDLRGALWAEVDVAR